MRHAAWVGILACDPAGTKTSGEASESPETPSETSLGSETDSATETDDATLTGSCAELWASPLALLDPGVVRLDPGSYLAMNLSLTYTLEANAAGGTAVVTLDGLTGRSFPDAGFSGDIYSYSGKFAQLRDSSDEVLYTQSEYYLIQESVEVPGTTGFTNVEGCPDDGYILLMDYPNDPDAAWVVLLQEPIDGMIGSGVPQEIVRIPLP